MADHSAARFGILYYEPGNPEFPTLPDGIPTPHVVDYGRAPGFSFAQVQAPEIGFSADDSDVAGWFFDGIWRSPNPVLFGTITQTKTRIVTVHNTFRTPIVLTAVDVSAVSGVTLTSPGLPQTIEPFDSVTLTFEAATIGDPAFDAEVILTVDGQDLPVRMTGRRILIYNTEPQRLIEERLSWLTDSMISVNGMEQAFSLRHGPRSRVTIRQRFTDDIKRNRALNQLKTVSFLRVGLQSWWQAQDVTAPIAIDDQVIQVSADTMELAAGDIISIVAPDYTAIQGEVDSIGMSNITLTEPILQAFPMGTSIMPIRFGFLQAEIDQDAFAREAHDIAVTGDLLEVDAIGAIDANYFETHPIDGRPIISGDLFFDGQSRRDVFILDTDFLDSRTGDIAATFLEPMARPGQRVVVYCDNHADQHAWRRFLHFVRGSWGVFYIPTGANDMPLATDLDLGTNTFEIPNLSLTQLVQNRAPRRDLAINVQGTVYYRRITTTAEMGVNEIVTINSAIPGTGSVPPGDVRVSWMMPARIVGDTATFRHQLRGQSELRFMVRGVVE